MKIQNKWITHSLSLSAVLILAACQSGELPNAISSTNGQSLSAVSQNALTLYSDSEPESLIYQGEALPVPPEGQEGMMPPPPPGEFAEGESGMMPPPRHDDAGMFGEAPERECKNKHHHHKARGEGQEGMMPPPPPEEGEAGMMPPPPPEEGEAGMMPPPPPEEGEEGQVRPPRRRR